MQKYADGRKMKVFKKICSAALVATMVTGLLTGCGSSGGSNGGSSDDNGSSDNKELVTLTVYSQLANSSGEMKGWFAKVMEDKFNVKINLVADSDGVYETRMEAGDLGDIVIWGADGKDYLQAVEAGMLLDWEEDNILADYGPYILENMSYALEKNKIASAQKDEEGNVISEADTIYGFGHNVAASSDSHEAFFYTWDIRWDLYQQLGHPEVKNLDDLVTVFEQMKEICPTDDNGNPTYAMSLWPDWDGNFVMYVKSMATAYYGYDEMGFGHYNVNTGEYYYALDTDSPYLEMLKFFNTMYRKGLLDPDSMTQTYDKMIEKVQNGGVFFSIFNYAGNLAYNKDEHISENKIMRSLVPTEATPLAYGMSVYGGNRVWSIGAKSQYPELCMEIINWLSTPEGRLTSEYGPRGLCWDYDENGKTYFTEFGDLCDKDRTTLMPEEWGGATFNDGAMQLNNTTWSLDDVNPETGERYNDEFWASKQSETGLNDSDQDWRDVTGVTLVEDYMENTNYNVSVATTYSESKRSTELDVIWEQVATCIKDYSWRAIYATSDEEFDSIVSEMRGRVKSYDTQDQCKNWGINEAAIKNALQEPIR